VPDVPEGDVVFANQEQLARATELPPAAWVRNPEGKLVKRTGVPFGALYPLYGKLDLEVVAMNARLALEREKRMREMAMEMEVEVEVEGSGEEKMDVVLPDVEMNREERVGGLRREDTVIDDGSVKYPEEWVYRSGRLVNCPTEAII
jgi:hypothetical protein